MTEREIIERARERIADPERQCRGTLAIDKHGYVDPEDPEATAWCAYGALVSVTPPEMMLDDGQMTGTALRPTTGCSPASPATRP